MVSASCFELSIGSKRAKAICAATRNNAQVSASVVVAAMCFCFTRRSPQLIAGPVKQRHAASIAGNRSAAKDGPVRSKKCDIDSV